MFGASPPPFPCHYLLAWLIDKSFVSHSKAEHIESIPHKAKKKHLSGVNFLAQRNSCHKNRRTRLQWTAYEAWIFLFVIKLNLAIFKDVVWQNKTSYRDKNKTTYRNSLEKLHSVVNANCMKRAVMQFWNDAKHKTWCTLGGKSFH